MGSPNCGRVSSIRHAEILSSLLATRPLSYRFLVFFCAAGSYAFLFNEADVTALDGSECYCKRQVESVALFDIVSYHQPDIRLTILQHYDMLLL